MWIIRDIIWRLGGPFRWLFYLPFRAFSLPARKFQVSLPARVAIVTGLALVLCLVAAILMYRFLDEHPAHWTTSLPGWLVAAALIPVICLVVHRLVRAWLEGDVTLYPDLERAFQAGLAELKAEGLDPQELPLFLVVGMADSRKIQALFDASKRSFRVVWPDHGQEPLHWYADRSAIFLVCRDASHLGLVAGLSDRFSTQPPGLVLPPPQRAVGDVQKTIRPGDHLADDEPVRDPAQAEQIGGGQPIIGTVQAGSRLSAPFRRACCWAGCPWPHP